MNHEIDDETKRLAGKILNCSNEALQLDIEAEVTIKALISYWDLKRKQEINDSTWDDIDVGAYLDDRLPFPLKLRECFGKTGITDAAAKAMDYIAENEVFQNTELGQILRIQKAL